MIITIDGPVASGKSTVSRMLADKLGFYYVCSGLIYRAIAYLLVHHGGYKPEDLGNIKTEDLMHYADPVKLRYDYDEFSQERIYFENNDITLYLKDKSVDYATSVSSVNKEVRKVVTTMQREIARNHNIVIDGRDVGSVVFPDAQVKFFITASVTVRAERWRKDQERYQHYVSSQEAVALITDRDERDKNRVIAPLVIPKNAIIIDTSDLTVQQTIEKMIECVKNL